MVNFPINTSVARPVFISSLISIAVPIYIDNKNEKQVIEVKGAMELRPVEPGAQPPALKPDTAKPVPAKPAPTDTAKKKP